MVQCPFPVSIVVKRPYVIIKTWHVKINICYNQSVLLYSAIMLFHRQRMAWYSVHSLSLLSSKDPMSQPNYDMIQSRYMILPSMVQPPSQSKYVSSQSQYAMLQLMCIILQSRYVQCLFPAYIDDIIVKIWHGIVHFQPIVKVCYFIVKVCYIIVKLCHGILQAITEHKMTIKQYTKGYKRK